MSTAKMFVPASLIVMVATVVLGMQTSLAEPVADECKTAPGSSAPPGQHWYYRVNRSDQRHCWYLGADGTKVRAQTRDKASSSPARTAREEASETAQAMPPPMEVIQTPPVPAASSERPAAAATEFAQPPLDLPQAPDLTAHEPATTSNASAPNATEAQEEMPLIWPVLTEAERAGLPGSGDESTPWSVFLIVGGALLVAVTLFKLAWRARTHGRRHPPLRRPRPRQQRRAHSPHPGAPSRSSRPQIRVAKAARRQAPPAADVNRSASGAKSVGAHA